MQDLQLLPGPRLLKTCSEKGTDGFYLRNVEDVTARAHEFLFAQVVSSPDVTLQDVFGLLQAAPLLVEVFRQDYAKELLAHAQKGVSDKYKPGYSPEGVEYLELYQDWGLNTGTTEVHSVGRLQLHGIGFELQDALAWDEAAAHPKGSRVEWSVSMTDVRELLPLPIRVRSKVVICEDDLDAKAYGKPLKEIEQKELTLGQLIQGLLWELSFYGCPEEQEVISTEMHKRLEDVKTARATGVGASEPFTDIEELFAELDGAGVELLFDSIGAVRPRDVSWALQSFEDSQPVQAGFDSETAKDAAFEQVQVKTKYREMPARAFRKLFRTARRAG